MTSSRSSATGGLNYGPVGSGTGDRRQIGFSNLTKRREDRRATPWEGWTEILSQPCILSIEDGGLSVEPAADLEALRTDRRRIEPGAIPPGDERAVEDGGACIEMDTTIDLGGAREVELGATLIARLNR